MNPWLSLLSLLLVMVMCLRAYGEEVYSFSGRVDFEHKSFALSVAQHEGRLDFKIDPRENRSYGVILNAENIQTPFFEMTTHIQGIVHVEENDVGSEKLSGRIWSEATEINHIQSSGITSNFELAAGILKVRDFSFDGFLASGSFAVNSPYALDAHFGFEDADITYFLDWLVGRAKKIEAVGTISGQVSLSGTPEKLMLKANVLSQNGHIEKAAYDLLSLQLQGVYPVVELTNSTVTRTNGFSFDLDGIVDLSDKSNMASQLMAIQKIPLIKDNALQSEWVLKRVQDSDGEGKTETEFFLKKDKKNGFLEQEDSSLLGVEKKIGF